jgi:hypothetical protein
MPETIEDLFRSTAITVKSSINQPHPTGQKAPKKQDYALPWPEFKSWRDARERLVRFEEKYKGKIAWAPFNDSESNDGPMSLNAYPGRALIERVTNEGDAALEAKALENKGETPRSPREAVAKWFDLQPGSLATGLADETVRALAQSTVTVSGFVGDAKQDKNAIIDARDFGIGVTADEMPSTILSLNRGNKKNKPYLTGKHGQGASSTYQYSDLTIVASRKIGSKTVAFTFVEARWDDENAKTPTYRYLTVDGRVPEVNVPIDEFPTGTLVRHIGYNATNLFHAVGEGSLYGLLMRSLAEPLFPVWLEIFALQPLGSSASEGYPTFPGYRRYGRVIRGSVNALERAWQKSLSNSAEANADDNLVADTSEAPSLNPDAKLLHRSSEFYELPEWDFGGRLGVGPLGRVKITYWVLEPAGRSTTDALRSFVDPDKTILMTLDGQTHAEESRSIVTGQTGAQLWAVGRYMVVQIDCTELTPRAKYELFTSTREHAKDTAIKKMIFDEVIRRLSYDARLKELNTNLAAAGIKQTEDTDETISSLIKKYLKASGVSFEQLTRKLEKWTEVEEERPGRRERPEPPPIEAHDPPTFVRWKFGSGTATVFPGQRASFIFETDAPSRFWNPGDQGSSDIKVLSHGVMYTGAGEMKGGRVRCHFICPEDAVIGTKGYVQVQLDYDTAAAMIARIPLEVIEKPKKVKRPQKPNPRDEDTDKEGQGSNTIKVKIRKKDFSEVEIPVVNPVAVSPGDSLWQTLGWPLDPQKVGFSIRALGGNIQLYFNAAFPPFLEMKRRMSKKSLEDEFVRRYKIKLVLHTIFTLNYEFVDEDEFLEDQRKRLRDLLCATAESLALATKTELEIESRLKSEDHNLTEQAATVAAENGSLSATDNSISDVAQSVENEER